MPTISFNELPYYTDENLNPPIVDESDEPGSYGFGLTDEDIEWLRETRTTINPS
jgi:hypothetical protein